MRTTRRYGLIAAVILCLGQALGQGTPGGTPAASPDGAQNPWSYNLTVDGYIVPNRQSYVDPVFTANRGWLHLEARYNYENLRTGSLWVGYNFTAGKKLVLDVTPMIGGVFGKTNGIAPGCEASLTYKRVQLSISNEYVFDTTHKSGSFYYSWPELTYSPRNWFRVGLVAEHTKAFHTSLDAQRGFLVGVSHKKWEFTTYVFNAGFTDPTVTLEVGVSF
ncbi:MAG: hypothetical protein WCC87_07065 [Candidatus Korobacteraceae bacterium]